MNYKLNEGRMFADVTDGVAIIIDSDTGIYYGLNTFGTSVYENLVAGSSIEDICAKIKTFSGAPSDIEKRIYEFVNSMVSFNLIIETGGNSITPNIDENIACEENFELNVQEYSDAKELLLTDPIHEVKEDSGWTPEKDSIGYTKEETQEREKKVE